MSMVENGCLGCKQNCCKHFKITREVIDPFGLREELKRYQFIKQVGKELVMGPKGERVVGVYDCGRFNNKTGECIDYLTEPRPPFCINTGVTSKPTLSCNL